MARRGIGWLLGVVVGFLVIVGVGASAAETWIRAARRSGAPKAGKVKTV